VLSHRGGVGVPEVAQLGRQTAYLGLCPFTRPLFWCLSKIFSKQTCDPSKSEKIIASVSTAARGICLPTCPDPVSTHFFAFTFFFFQVAVFSSSPRIPCLNNPGHNSCPARIARSPFPPTGRFPPCTLLFRIPVGAFFPPCRSPFLSCRSILSPLHPNFSALTAPFLSAWLHCPSQSPF